MTPERMEELADAWGADLRRWPAAERAAAEALWRRDAVARARLKRVEQLDALLDAHVVAPPDARLVHAVLAGVGPVRFIGRRRPWQVPRRWWWSGLGAAGVGLAGAAAGALAVSMAFTAMVPAPVASEGWTTTAFDGHGADGSEE